VPVAAPPDAPVAAKRELTDDLGKKVSIPANVMRVVSLAPNLTEIIYAVDGGEKLVGDTSYCNYPEAAKAVQKVGETTGPNLETVIALKPDVVLVSTASQIETFSKRLEEQGIAVFVTDPKDLDGIYRSIQNVGDILGKSEKATLLIDNLKKRVAVVEAKSEQGAGIRVFVQISEEPLYTAGASSFITDMIERAGGFSVTANIKDAYPKLSKETALALQPDVIILSDMAGAGQKMNPVFANSPAAKSNRIFKIDGDLLARPGPRIVDGLEQIAEKLKSE
jgi:iron complex transport system substrate-binding protein